jgi:hypothetical protein
VTDRLQLPASLSAEQIRAVADVLEAFHAVGRFGHLPRHVIAMPWGIRWDDASLPATAAGACCVVEAEGAYVIVIALRSSQPPDGLRHTLAHELAHAEHAELIVSGHDSNWLDVKAESVADRLCDVIAQRNWYDRQPGAGPTSGTS